MEKVTITIPTQYERMIQKVLDIVESMESEYNATITYRISCIANNAKNCLSEVNPEFRHDTIARAAAHALKAMEQIEQEIK